MTVKIDVAAARQGDPAIEVLLPQSALPEVLTTNEAIELHEDLRRALGVVADLTPVDAEIVDDSLRENLDRIAKVAGLDPRPYNDGALLVDILDRVRTLRDAAEPEPF